MSSQNSQSKKTLPFYQLTLEHIYQDLKSSREGLTSQEAKKRLEKYGLNSLNPPTRGKGISLFISQFKNSLILLLLAAGILAFFLGGRTDSIIILTIIFLSGILGFIQERGAVNAVEKMLQLVAIKTAVLRDGKEHKILLDQMAPGDVVHLKGGDLVPADCILIETHHFFVNESALTGESYPVEKIPGVFSEKIAPAKRTNSLFLGTIVASGTAWAIVVTTGTHTEYGRIAQRVSFHPPETAFELGVRQFGYFLLKITLILIIAIFIINAFLHKPIIESLLFSLAIAVGLTPQLLPAIITVNLSHGARRMSKKHVIIKRLASIENFGQMNILCADKTGTLTVGDVQLDRAVGIDGQKKDKVALYGFLNAHFQKGYSNPMDQAILHALHGKTTGWKKVREIPYDFNRKRLSVICENENKQILIVKGAVPQVLSVCRNIELPTGKVIAMNAHKKQLEAYFNEQSAKGFRTIALAYGECAEEKDLIFLGFLHFLDPIKKGVEHVIADLNEKGISLKIITGDHASVAAYITSSLGIKDTSFVTGSELNKMDDHALKKIVAKNNVFAEIEPSQKERIILALRKSGNVVGFIGDGINDITGMHSADVGIAVESGANAAKEIADIVLLRKDLSVLRDGIEEGRRTFVNTMKYIYMATSANFGNMFSLAGASLFLNFLPLLPKQVLLTNFFSDLPEMALATDRIDPESVLRPVKWDFSFIRRFMLVFGILSSLADYLTFGALLLYLKSDPALFRSGWFIESVVSAALIVLAIRTRRPLWRSFPGRLLFFSVIVVACGAPLLAYTSLGALFELTPMPLTFYPLIGAIIAFYILTVEMAKYFFFRKIVPARNS